MRISAVHPSGWSLVAKYQIGFQLLSKFPFSDINSSPFTPDAEAVNENPERSSL